MAQSIEAMESRYQRLIMNGKNTEGEGVLRKLRRKINKAKKEKEAKLS